MTALLIASLPAVMVRSQVPGQRHRGLRCGKGGGGEPVSEERQVFLEESGRESLKRSV